MKAGTLTQALCVLVLTGIISIPTAMANKDLAGGIGPIKSIHLRSTNAKSSAFWNYVVIASTSGDKTYHWGGSVCPGLKLLYQGKKDLMIDALAEYATFPDMCIAPFYKFGQGGYLCLVSFTASIRIGDSCDSRRVD